VAGLWVKVEVSERLGRDVHRRDFGKGAGAVGGRDRSDHGPGDITVN